MVASTQAAIIIDKHELHSTWPVYGQPESRHLTQEGVTLTVDRNQTCYGPGDRISVVATLKSDSLHTVILRGFELTLKESTTFRAGLYTSGKKTTPQVRIVTISESKLAVNATLYGGTQHKAELACAISPDHTTTSLNAARHIDVAYVICVKALMGTGTHLIMELPVIISNWQRNVSYEAIRRIGPAPGLSLLPLSAHPSVHGSISRVDPLPSRSPAAATLPITRPIHVDSAFGSSRNPSTNTYNTLPNHGGGYGGTSNGTNLIKTEELGYGAGLGFGARSTHNHSNSGASNQADEFGTRSVTSSGRNRRPDSSSGNSTTNRFTVANALPIAEQTDNRQRSGSGTGGGSLSSRGAWLSAEEEKKRLFENARAKVERLQGSVARVTTPPPNVAPAPRSVSIPNVSSQFAVSSRITPWPTAEEEKERLFNQAQAAAKKTQGLESYSPPSSLHGRSNSDQDRIADLSRAASSSKLTSNIKKPSPAAAMYSQAMSGRNVSESATKQIPNSPKASLKGPSAVPVPQYLTAEDEKAALKRYEQAKLAVDRVQNTGYSTSDENGLKTSSTTGPGGPIAYEFLYPNNNPLASSSTPAPNSDLPPPFETPASVIPASHLSEKDRLRRAYEAQDAATTARQNASYASPPPLSMDPYASATQLLNEKENLRRKFEAQDAQALAINSPPPQPPPRIASSNSRTQRPTPAPPGAPGAILTAAEEKALLKAQYASEDTNAKPRINGYNGHLTSPPPASPPSPPPLMPRPPVEYIQETQEEDARVSRFALNGILPPDEEVVKPKTSPSLAVHTITPFTAGFELGLPKIPGPPPPLPPKPAGE